MAIQTTATSSRRWARPRLLTLILTLVFVDLPVRTPPASAQDASPVAGADGGTLYTFDSGEAGFFTKTYFYDTGSEVVAFDAQFTPELAEQAITSLREQTDNPITYLVITHPNPDKFNGATAFQDEGAAVIASEATVAAIPDVHEYKKAGFVGMGMFTEDTYPPQAAVDDTFSGAHTLELGDGKTVELSELSEPGVSSTQTVAFIPGSTRSSWAIWSTTRCMPGWKAGSSTVKRHQPSTGGLPTSKNSSPASQVIRSRLSMEDAANRPPLGRSGRSDRVSEDSRSDRHRLHRRTRRPAFGVEQ